MAAQSERVTLREGFALLGRGIRHEPLVFTAAIFGSAVFGGATVLTSVVIGQVTDRVIVPAFQDGRTTTAALVLGALAIIGVGVVKAAGIIVRRYFAGVWMQRLQARYRRMVTRQYTRLPLSWHHRHPAGRLLSNANADVESSWWPMAPLPMAVGVMVMLVVAIASMFLADVVLAFVGVLMFPLIILVSVLYQRRVSPLATRAQALRAEVSSVAHESFDGALIVKAMGREADETARFAEVADRLREANFRVGRVRGAFDPFLDALPSLGVLIVLVVGVTRIDAGLLEPGTLVQVAYLLTIVAFPIRAIGWVLGELPRAVVGLRRVDAVLEATGAPEYGTVQAVPANQAADVDIRRLSYAYDGAEDVLREIDLDVGPGRTVAIVGPTGSGKSTLASLLIRLVDPRDGKILVDGTDTRELAPGVLAESAALVFQHAFIFEDTIRDNVALGRPIDDEDVWAALRIAQADGFVRELPAGLDAVVGERGASLSGGQRQRLALARAIVRQPRLLILDDATSAVDPEVEQRILAGLRDASLPATVVVVAYRRATIELADEVVYLDGGRIVARGTHDELMVTTPGYANLLTAYERDAAERAAIDEDEQEYAR